MDFLLCLQYLHSQKEPLVVQFILHALIILVICASIALFRAWDSQCGSSSSSNSRTPVTLSFEIYGMIPNILSFSLAGGYLVYEALRWQKTEPNHLPQSRARLRHMFRFSFMYLASLSTFFKYHCFVVLIFSIMLRSVRDSLLRPTRKRRYICRVQWHSEQQGSGDYCDFPLLERYALGYVSEYPTSNHI